MFQLARHACFVFCVTASASLAHGQSRAVTVSEGFQDPVVDPTGSRIAFALYGKIWIVPVTGGTATQITQSSGWDSHPAWSPDGRFLAYAHLRPGRSELVVRSLEDGSERTVHAVNADPSSVYPAVHGNVIGQIAWKPDGSELVFIEEQNQFSAHISSVSLLPDSKPKQITRGQGMAEWSFALAPDGKRAAVEWVQRGATDLFVVELDSARTQRLTTSADEEFSVQWSGNGKSLVYVARDNGLDRVIIRDMITGASRVVFESPFDGKQLALLPDGSGAVMVAGRRLHRLDFRNGRAVAIPVRARLQMPVQSRGNLIITNVRLWDGTGAAVRDSSWVLVRNGRIHSIGRGDVGKVDARGVTAIDGAGRFLMPGLMDNHFHYWHFWIFDAPRRLAMGITTARDPGTELAEALNLRAALRLGIIAGPDLYTTGPLIDGPCGIHPMVDVLLDKPEAGPPLVRALAAQGVDAIKVYHCLRPDVLRTVVSEARRMGLPVTGDLGNLTGWETAVDAGVTGLNHAYTYRGDYLPPEFRVFRENEPTEIRNARARLQTNIPVDPDRPEVERVFAKMARGGVALDPTLFIFALPDSTRRSLGVEEGERAIARWGTMQRFVKKAVDAGVTLLAGTDRVSLNDELESYEAAGVPRTTILQSATVNGAKWLGKDAEFGSIQPGRRAHLLLVEGDPLKQIKDLRQVMLVVKDGRVVFSRTVNVKISSSAAVSR